MPWFKRITAAIVLTLFIITVAILFVPAIIWRAIPATAHAAEEAIKWSLEALGIEVP